MQHIPYHFYGIIIPYYRDNQESVYDVDFDYCAPEMFYLLPKNATYEEIVALYLDMESNKIMVNDNDMSQFYPL